MIKTKIPSRPLEVVTGGAHEFDVDSEEWRSARGRVQDLQEVMKSGRVSVGDVASLAARWNVSRATVRRGIRRYQSRGNLTALLPTRRGRKPGVTMLDSAVEEVIRMAARQWWRRSENATIAEIEPTV